MPNTNYSLPVGDTISTSWDKVYGAKGSIWGAIGISILIAIGFGILGGVLSSASHFLAGVVNFIGQIVSTLISMGLLYMGICRAKNAPISFQQAFYAFDGTIALRVLGVYVIQFLIFLPLTLLFIFLPMIIFGTAVGDALSSGFNAGSLMLAAWILLGILVAIYITIRLILSFAFILDTDNGAWAAIKMSWATTRGNELKLFCIILFQMLAIIIGAIPFGIGLIWVLPFTLIIYGMTYKNLVDNSIR